MVVWPITSRNHERLFEPHYLDNDWRYRVGCNAAPIGTDYMGIEWSHDRWRHVTLEDQGHDPNMLRAQYFNKNAQLSLTNPRDAKQCQKFPQFEVITSSSEVGNPVFIVVNFLIQITSKYTLCSEKNTHSHFLSYLHEWCVDLNKNCSEYTQGKVDSDNVEIRYSLRHYDVIFV